MNAAAGRNYPPGDLRVSDADRDRAISELGEHFQAGRITTEELDERSGLALRAKTGNDLATLFADLPASQAPAMGMTPVPGITPALPRRHTPVGAIVAVVGAFLVVMSVVGLLSGGHGYQGYWGGGLLPLLVVVLILRRVVGGGYRGRRM